MHVLQILDVFLHYFVVQSQCHQSNVGEGFTPYSQRESVPYRQKSAVAERFRRHSIDGSPVEQESGLTENNHYHPYRRQCSEGAISEVQTFSCLRRAGLAGKLTTADGLEEQSSWSPLSTNVETTSIMVRLRDCLNRKFKISCSDEKRENFLIFKGFCTVVIRFHGFRLKEPSRFYICI